MTDSTRPRVTLILQTSRQQFLMFVRVTAALFSALPVIQARIFASDSALTAECRIPTSRFLFIEAVSQH
jgi:hypothetical protein